MPHGSTNIILAQPRLPGGGLVLNVLLRPLPLLLVMVIEMEGAAVVGVVAEVGGCGADGGWGVCGGGGGGCGDAGGAVP